MLPAAIHGNVDHMIMSNAFKCISDTVPVDRDTLHTVCMFCIRLMEQDPLLLSNYYQVV